MNYKKNRKIIGSLSNRKEYLQQHPFCENCGSSYLLGVHHHIPQQKRIGVDRFTIELPCNYSILCLACHAYIEHNERQYDRTKHTKPYEYWHTLKNGEELEKIIKE